MNLLVETQKQFESHKNAEQASQMKAYMKDNFDYLGIKSPERKQLQSDIIKFCGLPSTDTIEQVVIGLWSLPKREYQYFAMELANRVIKTPDLYHFYLIEYMLEYKQWWDSIDFIASNLVGKMCKSQNTFAQHFIHKWIHSPDMWLNRTAILFQLKYKEKTDTNLLTEAITPHIVSKEFFHQKAIGWALRQYSKINPDWVRDFISRNKLANLSVREASKYL